MLLNKEALIDAGLERTSSRSKSLTSAFLDDKKIACLTLDVECDYGDLLDIPQYEGISHIREVVDYFRKKNIPLTCFIQGSLFETHSKYICLLTEIDTEFQLHSYSHPGPERKKSEFEIKRGKEAYRKFFGRDPLGYRAPLGAITEEDYAILISEGFKYDSSIFPTLRPGVFNNTGKPVEPYFVGNSGLIEFPITIFSKWIRIPFALSYIKLLGEPYIFLLKNFNPPKLIIFDFHLHDLFVLNSAKEIDQKSILYQRIFKKIYINQKVNGLHLLNEFISLLVHKNYTFLKLGDVYNLITRKGIE